MSYRQGPSETQFQRLQRRLLRLLDLHADEVEESSRWKLRALRAERQLWGYHRLTQFIVGMIGVGLCGMAIGTSGTIQTTPAAVGHPNPKANSVRVCFQSYGSYITNHSSLAENIPASVTSGLLSPELKQAIDQTLDLGTSQGSLHCDTIKL